MAVFGNPFGPLYCLGFIAPAVSGTPAALSQNVPITITGIGSVGMTANQLICQAAPTNTDLVFLCFRGATKSIPNGQIIRLTAGQSITLGTSAGNSPYRPADLVVDANVNGEGMLITCVIAA